MVTPKSNSDLLPVYTEWANHYLEKCQKKRVILDLQKDMQDSLLLIDIIESVVGEKVPNVKRKPKNTAQVVENIGYCLQYLSTLGVILDGIVAKDIRDGQLKSILGLFYNLSQYKQRQKTLSKLQNGSTSIPTPSNTSEMLSKLPSPFKSQIAANGAGTQAASSLPTIATNRQQLNSSTAPNICSNTQPPSEVVSSVPHLSKSSSDSSANKVKSGTTGATKEAKSSVTGKAFGLKPPSTVKIPTSTGKIASTAHASSIPSSSGTSNSNSSNLPAPKDAKMLDKLKLFASKDKSNAQQQSPAYNSIVASANSPRLTKSVTRTSNSSSGFSSAKSELSETSSNYEAPTTNSKFPLALNGESPKLGAKSLTKKSAAKSSPKSSRKDSKSKLDDTSNSYQQSTSPKLMRRQQASSSGSMNALSKNNAYETDASDINPLCNKSAPSTSVSKLKPPVTSPTSSQIPGFAKCSGGIPKPTLAVKGMKPVTTAKPPSDSQTSAANGPASSFATAGQQANVAAVSDQVSSQLKHSASTSDDQGVLNEREKFLQIYKAQRSYSSAVMKTSNPSSPVTVGVVSPITHHKKLPLNANATSVSASMDLNSSLDSQGGHQSDSNSSHTSGNLSDTASVIYCPSADEKDVSMDIGSSASARADDRLRRNKSKSPGSAFADDSAQKLRELSSSPARTQSRLETTFDSSDGVVVTQTVTVDDDEPPGLTGVEEEVSNSLQPMQPLIPRASPYAYLRGLGSLPPPSPSSSSRIGAQSSTASISADQASNSKNARTKSPRLLINRPLASLLHADGAAAGEEMDIGANVVETIGAPPVKCAAGEVSAGYVSEGDALPLSDKIDLDISGYMSEGGISLYARKLQARFREGLEAVRDSMRKPTDIIDDSFEDSSSLSSGISETIDEISTDDLTGSSLSDQAFNPYGSLKHNIHNSKLLAASVRKSESGQQTEKPSSSKLHAYNNVGGHQHRKLSDQYDPQRIDLLLQKCRTSTRGLNASNQQQHQHQRPKSEQMMNGGNFATMSLASQRSAGRLIDSPEIELSADGQTLHVSASTTFAYRRVQPMTMNSLHILKRGDHQQNGDSMLGGSKSPAGYHSLDRKKHLLGQNGDHLKYCSESDSLYVNYPPPRSNGGAALAMVSPRHVASLKKGAMSLPVSHEGPLPPDEKDIADTWTRHTVGGQSTVSMSRSMIEPEMKLGIVGQEQRLNGQARLSIPPQQNMSLAAALQHATNGILQGSGMQCRSPRVNDRTSSTQSESGFIRKESGEMTSPSSQMYFHKLAAANGTTFGQAPSSPGSMSAPATSRLSGHSHSYNNSPYLGNVLDKVGVLEEVHGSSLSLASSSSSVYSTAEEKYQSEIRKLHRDLEAYKDKVQTLTTQQSTYAHVVAAFEQSLQSMTKRVQSLTQASEQKDCELTDLKSKIDVLRTISVAKGLNIDEVLSSPNLQRRHTFNTNEPPGLIRQLSSDSMTSVVSQRSSMSAESKNGKFGNGTSSADKKGKKSWTPILEMPSFPLRSSFTKAFGKGKKNKNGSISDVDENHAMSDNSNPASPMHTPRTMALIKQTGVQAGLSEADIEMLIGNLKKQVFEKEAKLTDARLEALTSAQQADQWKDIVARLHYEVAQLKNENHRLESVVTTTTSRAPSQSSLPLMCDDTESISDGGNVLSDMSVPISVDAALGENREGFRITLSVQINLAGELLNDNCSSILIGSMCLSYKTKWDLLDTIICKMFKEYVLRIDQVSNLGLSAESILGYSVSGFGRSLLEPIPHTLPCSLLNENRPNVVRLTLKGCHANSVDALAFETLIPKSIVQRYVHVLMEHRRVIFCGSCGTGKTYLARKLAEYLVIKSGRSVDDCSIVSFNIDNQAVVADLKKYFAKVAESAQHPSNNEGQAVVVILDNLQNVASMNDTFMSLLNVPSSACPYIIGCMNQPSSNSTNLLQLHHNFRWVSFANHVEPVKGFLPRYLRRRQIEGEIQRGSRYSSELTKVLEWLPKVWTHLNKFLESINSPDVTIGPRLFLSCPLDVDQSRDWFIGVWNYYVIPYLLQASKEGLQLYGRRAVWEDPVEWVIQSWPWLEGDIPDAVLTKLRLEDLGVDTFDTSKSSFSDNDSDPLVMLMRLQEQAKRQRQKEMDFLTLKQNGVESTL